MPILFLSGLAKLAAIGGTAVPSLPLPSGLGWLQGSEKEMICWSQLSVMSRGDMKTHLDQHSYGQKASKQSLDRPDYLSLLSTPNAAAAANLQAAERPNISLSSLQHEIASLVLYWYSASGVLWTSLVNQ